MLFSEREQSFHHALVWSRKNVAFFRRQSTFWNIKMQTSEFWKFRSWPFLTSVFESQHSVLFGKFTHWNVLRMTSGWHAVTFHVWALNSDCIYAPARFYRFPHVSHFGKLSGATRASEQNVWKRSSRLRSKKKHKNRVFNSFFQKCFPQLLRKQAPIETGHWNCHRSRYRFVRKFDKLENLKMPMEIA